MMRVICLTTCLCAVGPALLRAAPDAAKDARDAPRVDSTLSFSCTPDAKARAAGAQPFDDTLELGADRVKSATLAEDGFPVGLAIPKLVNGVTTINVTFKKKGAAATYFVRAKRDGVTSGAFTRTEGGRTLRYTIGATSAREAAGDAPAKHGPPADPAAAGLEPAVLRVNGGFVRLMSVHTAMADAGVDADRAKVAEILKTAGADQNAMRAELLDGAIKPADYVSRAGARLAAAHASSAQALGAEKAARVDAAYEAPFAATYVHLNQMRAAAAETAPPPDAAKRVDKAIYAALVGLTTLAEKRALLTPDAVTMIKDDARAAVLAELAPDQRERFKQTFAGLSAEVATNGAGKPDDDRR